MVEAREDTAEAVVGAEAGGGQGVAVALEDLGQERAYGVAEEDGVGDLHHGGLEMEGEENTLVLGATYLSGIEVFERADAHSRGVDHLTGQHRHALPQDGRVTVL